MSWNYRIIDFGTHKALHEVYYDNQNGNPLSYTENPATFVCDPDVNEIADSLIMALSDAENRPILSIAEFDNNAGTELETEEISYVPTSETQVAIDEAKRVLKNYQIYQQAIDDFHKDNVE